MGVIFEIGVRKDLPPIPEGFPTCGNWISQAKATEDVEFHSKVTLSSIGIEDKIPLKSSATVNQQFNSKIFLQGISGHLIYLFIACRLK